MQALVDVILPVFLVIGAGYLVVWRKMFSDAAVDGLMGFAQNFAFPCLLFRAISQLNLDEALSVSLFASFYTGAFAGFAAGLLGARLIFRRPWQDSIAIGFCGMFSNSLLLGVPITERAYGADALQSNFAIISVHAPILYGVGLTIMELTRAQGAGPLAKAKAILTAVFRNGLILGIALGFVANLTNLPVPEVVGGALDLVSRAALPAALFALGGILYRYRPEGDMATITMVCLISLVLHPLVTYTLGKLTGLTTGQLRSAVLTASMAPGVNTYIFANMYGVARRVAASALLMATALSIVTIWIWLAILP
ncbi:MAG: malonate transporter [Maritimibacter sp.]|nr:malonate transporter [Maritimibacter sp.]